MRCAFGFDPSINDPAWAVVYEDGSVMCGMIRNPYRKQGKTEHWEKLSMILDHMHDELRRLLKELPTPAVAVCEGQYCQRRGNQDHNVRLGWVSSMAYTLIGNRCPKMIAIPSTWTRNQPKELRHPELLATLKPESEWTWLSDKPPAGLMHNIYDAVGLAVWGLNHI